MRDGNHEIETNTDSETYGDVIVDGSTAVSIDIANDGRITIHVFNPHSEETNIIERYKFDH